jgi:hypothetical protein
VRDEGMYLAKCSNGLVRIEADDVAKILGEVIETLSASRICLMKPVLLDRTIPFRHRWRREVGRGSRAEE